MPFTLAHAAAALPFRQTRLVFSAVIVGTFGPDLEYFVRFAPTGGFGHTLTGMFLLTLPLCLIVLWLFHKFVKLPVTSLLADSTRGRVMAALDDVPFKGVKPFVTVVLSILVGAATHIFWDSFTHPTTWLYAHWSFLHHVIYLPFLGPVGYYKVLQHASTLAGLAFLLHWYRNWRQLPTCSLQEAFPRVLPRSKAINIAVILGIIATVGALVRATIRYQLPQSPTEFEKYAAVATVTAISLLWWQFVLWGVVLSRRKAMAHPPIKTTTNPQDLLREQTHEPQ